MSQPAQGSSPDMAAAYALGALGPEESREFEALIAASPEFRLELDDYREVSALLGLAVSEAGTAPDLRGRVLAKVRERRSSASAGRSRSPLALWGALAASLLLVLGLGTGLLALRQELGQRQALLDAILQPGVQLFQLTSSGNREPAVQLFWNRSTNEALLNGVRLAPMPEGRAYQLWFMQGGKPVPSITFAPAARGAITRMGIKLPSGPPISAAAITVEPEGGSLQPTSPILLMGPLGKR